jgi:hypothetical protein
MKFRKSRPSIAASMGRMIVLSIPKRPDASPERKAVAASVHSSAVTQTPFGAGRPDPKPPVPCRSNVQPRDRRGGPACGNVTRSGSAGPGRHDLPNLPDWSVASPHVATISKTVVSPLSQLPRLLRRLPAGSAHLVARTSLDTRRPFVSAQPACQFLHHGGLTRQWEHFSQDRAAGRVTSSGRASLTPEAKPAAASAGDGCFSSRGACPTRPGGRGASARTARKPRTGCSSPPRRLRRERGPSPRPGRRWCRPRAVRLS